MIIHDMRGPVNSMKIGLEHVIENMNSYEEYYEMQLEMRSYQDVIEQYLEESVADF